MPSVQITYEIYFKERCNCLNDKPGRLMLWIKQRFANCWAGLKEDQGDTGATDTADMEKGTTKGGEKKLKENIQKDNPIVVKEQEDLTEFQSETPSRRSKRKIEI